MRQREDQTFARVLANARLAKCSENDIALLMSRDISKSNIPYPTSSLHVFKTNKDVDEHNFDHLQKLTTRVFHIKLLIRKRMLTLVSLTWKFRLNRQKPEDYAS